MNIIWPAPPVDPAQPTDDDLTLFRAAFTQLQGNEPFPWQETLFQNLVSGDLPSALDLPTGLGKTSVMAIWYVALKAGAFLPRRLVYVVDRRAVVDQATLVAETIREKSGDESLRISTLRGKYTDNRDWLADPTSPAIIVGTVDMIGSRILFSGYAVSSKMRPYHAGFLGADTLVVLDEAHLVPPFEALLKTIARDPTIILGPRDAEDRKIVPRFRLMSLSATGREDKDGDGGRVFRLTDGDRKHTVVSARLNASKHLTVDGKPDGELKLTEKLATRAWALGTKPRAARVLVYCNSRKDAQEVQTAIKRLSEKTTIATQLLVGERRVREREALFNWLKETGFVDGANNEVAIPTFLISTSAGEVGVDLDADEMVCDLVEWERMVQRLGRVNRRGHKQAHIEVIAVQPKEKKQGAEEWKDRLARLRAPLDKLPAISGGGRDASPGAIAALKENEALKELLEKAQTPAPLRPELTRSLVDAWSMTSLEEHAGRPDIQPWLRGWEKNDEPHTNIVWRKYLPVRDRGADATREEIETFFEAAPPHLSEVLEAETWRVVEWLIARAELAMKAPPRAQRKNTIDAPSEDGIAVFVMDRRGKFERSLTIGELADLDRKDRKRNRDAISKVLIGSTVVVSAELGGLSTSGMLDDKASSEPETIEDLAKWEPAPTFRIREATGTDAAPDKKWREFYRFVTAQTADGDEARCIVIEQQRDRSQIEDSRAITNSQRLDKHQSRVRETANELARALSLPPHYANMLAIAAQLHDEGKKVPRWQRAFCAPIDAIYAKTTGPVKFRLLHGYRHEFGSLAFVESDTDFRRLPEDLQDLALHLVAAHHGGARPFISTQGCDDAPPSALKGRACDVALRFARLQKRWGPWGLAWWESLLRAADQKASRDNDTQGDEEIDGAKIVGDA